MVQTTMSHRAAAISLRLFIWLSLVFATFLRNGWAEAGVLMLTLSAVGLLILRKRPEGAPDWTRQDTLMSLAFVSFVGFKALSALWSPSAYESIRNAVMHLPLLLWPLLLVVWRRLDMDLKTVRLGLAWALVFLAAWVLLRHLLGDEVPIRALRNVSNLNTGVLAQLAVVGAMMCVAPWAIGSQARGEESQRFRILMLAAYLGGLLVVLVTVRRTEWLGFVVVSLALLIWRFRRGVSARAGLLIASVVIAAVLVGGYFMQAKFLLAWAQIEGYLEKGANDPSALYTSVGLRLEFYYRGLLSLLENPWLGVGAGVKPADLQYLVPSHLPIEGHRHFHSSYLQILVEGGLVFGLLTVVAVLYVWRKTILQLYARRPTEAVTAATVWGCYALSGVTGEALMYGATTAFFAIATSLTWAWASKASVAVDSVTMDAGGAPSP